MNPVLAASVSVLPMGCASAPRPEPVVATQAAPAPVVLIDPEDYYPEGASAELVIHVDEIIRSYVYRRARGLFSRFVALEDDGRWPAPAATLISVLEATKEIRAVMSEDVPGFFGSAVAKRSMSTGENGEERAPAVFLVQGTYSFEDVHGILDHLEPRSIAGHPALIAREMAFVELGDGWWLVTNAVYAEALLRSPGRPASMSRPGWARLSEALLPDAGASLRLLPREANERGERGIVLSEMEGGAMSVRFGADTPNSPISVAALTITRGSREAEAFARRVSNLVAGAMSTLDAECSERTEQAGIAGPAAGSPTENRAGIVGAMSMQGSTPPEEICTARSSLESVVVEQTGSEVRVRARVERVFVDSLFSVAEQYVGLIEALHTMGERNP